MTKNNQTYYLSYNHLGSLRVVTDSSGNIVKEIEYSAYGEILLVPNVLVGNPYDYTPQ